MLWQVLGSLNRLLERVELCWVCGDQGLTQMNCAEEPHNKGKDEKSRVAQCLDLLHLPYRCNLDANPGKTRLT